MDGIQDCHALLCKGMVCLVHHYDVIVRIPGFLQGGIAHDVELQAVSIEPPFVKLQLPVLDMCPLCNKKEHGSFIGTCFPLVTCMIDEVYGHLALATARCPLENNPRGILEPSKLPLLECRLCTVVHFFVF